MVNIRAALACELVIRVQNRWIRYYPEALTGAAAARSRAGRPREPHLVLQRDHRPAGTRPTRDMGNGHFANRRWPFAAYMRNMMVQTTRQGGLAEFNGTAWGDRRCEIHVEDHFRSGTVGQLYLARRAGRG
jgi:hypothetical protein